MFGFIDLVGKGANTPINFIQSGVIINYSHTPFVIILLILLISFSIIYGAKILELIIGNRLIMWIKTGDLGLSFAYISIALFRSDKKFSYSEMEKLCNYLESEFGQGLYNTTKVFIRKNMKSEIHVHNYTSKIRRFNYRQRVLFLHHLFSMAMADDKYSNEENLFLIKIAKQIKINKASFEKIKSRFVQHERQDYNYQSKQNKKSYSKKQQFSKQFFSPEYDAYEILGQKKSDGDAQIKKAYRKLLMMYHPDKLNAKSSAYKKVAKQKLQEVIDAYEIIKKERGL